MGVAIAGAVIAGVGLIASIEGQAAQARHNNAMRINNWVQGESEKAINNGKEEYMAVYNEMQQAERNRAINLGAYQWGYEQRNRLQEDHNFATKQMSLAANVVMGSNVATQSARGVSGSGTAKRQRMSNLLNLQQNLGQANQNLSRSIKDTRTQESNMRSSMGKDVFRPNIQGPSARPEMEDDSGIMGMLMPF